MTINMSTYTYKTKDGSTTGFIPGFGAIVDGVITSTSPIESPNLVLVSDGSNAETEAVRTAPIVGTASQQNPNQPETADGPVNTGEIK